MSVEPLPCVGALIVDDDHRIFVQRRSADRRLFPNCWDVVGGHVEADESLEAALSREITEETGWRLFAVLGAVGEYRYVGNDGIARIETDFLVRVDGDLSRPRLEVGRHTEARWLTEADTALLDEGRDDGEPRDGDHLIRQIVEAGFVRLRELVAGG